MKKIYEAPVLNMVLLANEDVIATSNDPGAGFGGVDDEI